MNWGHMNWGQATFLDRSSKKVIRETAHKCGVQRMPLCVVLPILYHKIHGCPYRPSFREMNIIPPMTNRIAAAPKASHGQTNAWRWLGMAGPAAAAEGETKVGIGTVDGVCPGGVLRTRFSLSKEMSR